MTRKRRHYSRKASVEFGAYLKKWRDAANLTQEEAAPLLGLGGKSPEAYLSQIETGHKAIPEAALLNVHKVYNVAAEEVLRRAYWPQLVLLPLIAIIDPEQLSKDLIEDLEKGLEEEERREITRHIEELLLKRGIVKQR